ncbi:hypothetical protein GF362_01670 [Candidatus Dojkabacteria bacterium]|nr:hypothetical protein [Candidatus Dojkabacteria bacterium]
MKKAKFAALLVIPLLAILLSGCSKKPEYKNLVVEQDDAVVEYVYAFDENQSAKYTIKQVTYDYMPEGLEEKYDPHEEENQFVKVDFVVEGTGTEPLEIYEHQIVLNAGLEEDVSSTYKLMDQPSSFKSVFGDTSYELQPGETKEFSMHYEIFGGILEAASDKFSITIDDDYNVPLVRKVGTEE